MAISRYRLQTVRVTVGEKSGWGYHSGFMGSCTYAFLVKDRYWMGLIHMLAAFAFYSGVGKKTTMGMGQCRRASNRKMAV